MIYIEKQRPSDKVQQEIISAKQTVAWKKAQQGDPQSAREVFDSLNKQILREQLYDEQHGLCAYCMRKINEI